ncbi:MAG: uracil-DNA glycosylase [Candidatus Omnitrophica bacterium]|nr:uracil-DNA glycosylase [Candidatus Omnitrophota bacterium]
MDEFSKIIKSIKMYLETDKLAGVREVFTNKRIEPAGEKKISLEDLKKNAQECEACQLHKRRTNLVFGSGDPGARLMFVGEAPGADEDLQGEPFVGRAGQLLTKMIEAIDMKRGDVYIANILKCRPPNNRSPLPDEIAACNHFVEEQIKAIHPRVICALGKFASQFLLKSDRPISALRGKFYEQNDIKIMPTFHPAYLLRNPNDKRLVWEDLKKIRDELKKT